MNEHSLRVLEFDRFLELLCGYAASEPGRARLRALRPRVRAADTAEAQRLYADGLRLRAADVPLPAARFESPERLLARAAPEGAVLDAEEFVELRRLMESAQGVRVALGHERCAPAPDLQQLGAALDGCLDLARRIDATFEGEHAHVRDGASDRLREVRRRIAAIERGIEARLEALVRDASLVEALQEQFVTVRHDRHVVPVRREFRGKVPGIVHDQSNSGATLFIEPADVVEAGNELEMLRLDERDEVRRVLAALTVRVRGEAETLRTDYELLTLYDTVFAVSAWGRESGARCAEVGSELCLRDARHPLLAHRLAREGRLAELVPLDVEVPEGRNVVVITGSNTGGKTVALKTIGLVSLLAQAGLPVPAGEGTRVRFFEDVLADIGDEQSIEQSLSTFSAHLQHIVETLAAARGAAALVLLDELGAGTDPVEGGALGCAILDALCRAQGLTFATTHLGAVKRFVHAHPRMMNASMLFDAETLRPQYRLQMGRAGASYALTIAERCGLPADVLTAARGLLSEADVRLESMLTDLNQTQLQLDREREAAERTRTEAEKAREVASREQQTASHELRDLRRRRRKLLHEAQGEAASLVDNTRREMERILSQARKAPAKPEAKTLREQVGRRQETIARSLEETRERPEQPFGKGELQVGDRVWVPFLQDHARVAAVSGDGERATVEAGRMRLELRRTELGRPRAEAGKAKPAAVVPPKPFEAPRELSLIGLRVEEALPRLERFLDTALLAGAAEVRIVHGYGTGALRKAVHEYLQKAPISGFRLGDEEKDAGGAGATMVRL
jgi:DNA mismatch repair protein MutS2